MQAPLHPALVHVPLGLSMLAPLVIAAVMLGRRRCGWPRSTLLLPLAVQAIVVAGAVLAMRSGEADEDRVEGRAPDAAVERHEDLAGAFTWSAGGVLVLLGGGMLLSAGRARTTLLSLAGAGSLVVCGLGIATGQAGGELVYVHGAAGGGTGAPPTPDDHDR
jgi:uncharacterized membrane protein